jgi:hypothetical protein
MSPSLIINPMLIKTPRIKKIGKSQRKTLCPKKINPDGKV